MQFVCPHCDQPAKIRTSRKITELTREYYVQCENAECFHAWVVIASGVRTLQPSLNPNPLVYVPVAARKRPEPNDKQAELPLR